MNTFFFDDVQYPEGLFGGKDFFNPIIYSTEEREVGVWIDNKPLYQKTIVFGSITNRSSISIGVENVEHISLVPDGSWVNDSCRPLPYVIGSDASNNIGGYFTIGTSDTSFEVRMGNGSASDSRNGVITVQYTKTTDVAGSAQYTTLGVPAHHYDGNEKVVGTYYDETLYEKSYIQQLSNGSTSIDISDLNADYAFIESGFYDIGVTKLALNEIIDVNSRLYTYTHINTGSQYLNIDCKNTVSATSTIHITIRYTKTS